MNIFSESIEGNRKYATPAIQIKWKYSGAFLCNIGVGLLKWVDPEPNVLGFLPGTSVSSHVEFNRFFYRTYES